MISRHSGGGMIVIAMALAYLAEIAEHGDEAKAEAKAMEVGEVMLEEGQYREFNPYMYSQRNPYRYGRW